MNAIGLSSNRPPQARVLRNDERILDAAVDVLANQGWGGFNVASVARKANLSHPAVKDRFPSRSASAQRIWVHRLGERFDPAMEAILALVDDDGNTANAAQLQDAFQPWLRPNAELRASAELLVGAHHGAKLFEAMDGALGAMLRTACTPSRQTSETVATQRAYLAILAFGFAFLSHRAGQRRCDYDREFEAIADAFAHPTDPQELPLQRHVRTIDKLKFDTGHDEHDALLRATLELVAEHGYHDVTIDDFAQAIGVTKGFIFARYETKAQLFLDASQRQRAMSLEANLADISAIAANHGNGVAEAATIIRLLHPSLYRLRALDLEQLQLLWHDDALAASENERLDRFGKDYAKRRPDATPEQVEAHVHLSRAVGVGLDMLPLFIPKAHKLPYDVITVPLHERPSSTN